MHRRRRRFVPASPSRLVRLLEFLNFAASSFNFSPQLFVFRVLRVDRVAHLWRDCNAIKLGEGVHFGLNFLGLGFALRLFRLIVGIGIISILVGLLCGNLGRFLLFMLCLV